MQLQIANHERAYGMDANCFEGLASSRLTSGSILEALVKSKSMSFSHVPWKRMDTVATLSPLPDLQPVNQLLHLPGISQRFYCDESGKVVLLTYVHLQSTSCVLIGQRRDRLVNADIQQMRSAAARYCLTSLRRCSCFSVSPDL